MMMMEGRRVRRFGRGQHHNHSFLPLRTGTSQIHNTLSCCYCDFKIFAFNQPLSRFGTTHAKSFRLWFSIGVGFTLTALLGVTMILVWDLFNTDLSNLSTPLVFGFSPSVYGFTISLADAGFLFISTLISVSVHEFGHAVAAASEGIQMEYIAIFIALLFPGALVAFNYDLLQALPPFTALRVYCAGIWHNAVCCAVCGLVLFLLPLILFPFYIHGESPMVLDVPSSSPLSGYLSPGDVIVLLDGVRIHNAQQWMEMIAMIDKQTLQNSNHSIYSKGFGTIDNKKGYCVPSSMREESKKIRLVDNQSACPSDLTAFVTIHCFNSSKMDDVSSEDGHPGRRESGYCLNAKDVVKRDKCGDGWVTALTNGSSCICSQDESCLSPVQLPGLIWVEITYSSPYSLKCLYRGSNTFPVSNTSDIVERNCGGTFVFVGDVISMAHSVRLTSYQPRWAYASAACLPNLLERSLMCTFHVSLTLALLNSLPVYFLDGESILEATLCHFTSMSPRKRKKVLQICLLGGTLISILAFLRIFFINFL